MSLLVPIEFIKDINKYSGYINPKSPYSGKNLKGLFFTPENCRYLAAQLYSLIINPTFVEKNMVDPNNDPVDPMSIHNAWGNNSYELANTKIRHLIGKFRDPKIRKFLNENIIYMMEFQQLPYREDTFIENPVMQLHHLNRDFLLKSGHNIIQSPEMLIPRYFATNLETGLDESHIEYDYTSESYADGTWHPEHLFTNSRRNHENPYWLPLEVSYYSNAEESGLGHRYYNKDAVGMNRGQGYGRPPPTGEEGVGLYSHTQRTRSQFPRWQDSGARKQYEYEIRESLDEGGLSDRRVQVPHGYNMRHLVSKSTY